MQKRRTIRKRKKRRKKPRQEVEVYLLLQGIHARGRYLNCSSKKGMFGTMKGWFSKKKEGTTTETKTATTNDPSGGTEFSWNFLNEQAPLPLQLQ